MGEDQTPDPGGAMDSEPPGNVNSSKSRKTSLDIYDVTTLARQSYEEEKISPLRQLRLMNECFIKRPKASSLSNRKSADPDNRRRSPNNHSARYIELSENVRNMARRNSFDLVQSVEFEKDLGASDLPSDLDTLHITPPPPPSDPVIDNYVPSDELPVNQEQSYYNSYSFAEDQMPVTQLDKTSDIVSMEFPKNVRNIPGVLQIPDSSGRLESKEPRKNDTVIYDMTSPKPVIDVKLSKDPTSPKYVPVKRPMVRMSKSTDDFLSDQHETCGFSDNQQIGALESDKRWSRSDTGSEAYSSRSEKSCAGSEQYSSRSEKSYSGSDKRSNASERCEYAADKYSSRSAGSDRVEHPQQTDYPMEPPKQERLVSDPMAGDDFFMATMAAMGNIMDKYESSGQEFETHQFSHSEKVVSFSDEDLPLPDFPDDSYDGAPSECSGDSFPPAMYESPPRSPVDRDMIPSPVSPSKPNREYMLTSADLTRVELFYKGRGSHVVVCHCVAEFYEQNDQGQWVNLNRGVPVFILTTGEKRGQKRELKIVLAECGTGFRLWEDTINYLSNYTDESPKVHTMQQSRDHTKRVSFRMHSVAASTEFLGKFKEMTSDPNDELWKMGKTKKSKKSRTFFSGKKNKKKLHKKDISQPCNFMHVTKVEPIDHSPLKDPSSEEFRQRRNTSDW